jgi:hypothetical protein
MAKEFTYRDSKTGKVLFQSVEANYVSKETVDQKVKEKTGHDPRLERHTIECVIRVVNETPKKSIGRYDKNKRMT